MISKIKETLNDHEAETLSCKTPGLNNPETYMLTHTRFIAFMVLILSDLNKAQILKCRIEIVVIMKMKHF